MKKALVKLEPNSTAWKKRSLSKKPLPNSGEADIPLTLLEQKNFILQSDDVITTTQTVF